MKALRAATSLLILLVAGVVAWAMANGSPLAGEPTASLLIKQDKNREFGKNIVQPQGPKRLSGGLTEVVLNVSAKDQQRALAMGENHGEGGLGHGKQSKGKQGSGLLEKSKFGLLPKRAADGTSPAATYAKKQIGRRDTLPRIAILITGLGLNQRLSQEAIRKMPAKVSLAFSAYGRRLPQLTSQAKRFGHEYMLQVPMEPLDFRQTDTGSKTLLANQSAEKNRPLLHWSLGRLTGYFGIANYKGGRYLAKAEATAGLFKELQSRGLVFFHDDASGHPIIAKIAAQTGLGYSRATLLIDRKPTRKGSPRPLINLKPRPAVLALLLALCICIRCPSI